MNGCFLHENGNNVDAFLKLLPCGGVARDSLELTRGSLVSVSGSHNGVASSEKLPRFAVKQNEA